MIFASIICLSLVLAFANGANDNFKGVATLYGSKTTGFNTAIWLATITTAVGSILALILAKGLLASFSGKGLVPTEVVADPRFAVAVALGSSATVLLASRLGFPVSTTHALIGALVGTGLLAASGQLNLDKLGKGFLWPLLSSPLLAVVAAMTLYPFLRRLRLRMGVGEETCICVENAIVAVMPGRHDCAEALRSISMPKLNVNPSCRTRYSGQVLGIQARQLLDAAHFLSAGAVSLARGLNDTPKIAAILLLGGGTSATALIGVGVMIAVGGLVFSRRVADTMSHRVTDMNSGQGFTANIITSGLVIAASKLGLPVSTTHVSCGSLFGIGAVSGGAHWRTITSILTAWLVTLPLAGIIAAGSFWSLGFFSL